MTPAPPDPAQHALVFRQVPVSLVPTRKGASKVTRRAYEDLSFAQMRPIAGGGLDPKILLHTLTTMPSSARLPLSFEVFGNRESLTVQWAGSSRAVNGLCTGMTTAGALVDLRRDASDVVNEVFRDTAGSGLQLALGDIVLGPDSYSVHSPPAAALSTLLHALAALPAGRFGLFQVLMSRCSGATTNWMKRLSTQHEDRATDASARRIAQVIRTDRKRKFEGAGPLMGVAVRLVVLGPPRGKVAALKRLLEALRPALSGPRKIQVLREKDWGVAYAHKKTPKGVLRFSLLRRVSFRTGTLLSAAELAPLITLPSTRGLPIQAGLRPLPAAGKVLTKARDAIPLGVSLVDGRERPVFLPAKVRARHVAVLGRTRKGKSTLLCNLILNDIEAGHGVAVVDPTDDLVLREVLPRLDPRRYQDVVLLDAGAYRTQPFAANLFAMPDGAQPSQVAADTIAFFRMMFAGSWGPQLEETLTYASLACLSSTRSTTIHDCLRLIIEEPFRDELLRSVKDKEVKRWWIDAFPSAVKMISSVRNKLASFATMDSLKVLFGHPAQSFDLTQAMAKRRIVLINIPKGRLEPATVRVLGAFFVSRILSTALGRSALDKHQRPPFHLYVDEAHNYATPSFTTMLSEAAKYNLSVTMATQYLEQYPKDVREAVLGNAGSIITFQVGTPDARALSRDGSNIPVEAYLELGVGQAIVRTDAAPRPFLALTPPPRPLPASYTSSVLDELRAKVAVNRTEDTPKRPEPDTPVQRVKIEL